ncbi:hypothetical protein SAMN02910358_00695 [Lachnospiraceae bacterium XBB1006]|nr:hypothetical protein SAMN02910358_00695 [Lachnospiraceae bacterium XBB1006]
MMKYEMFKEVVKEKFQEYFHDDKDVVKLEFHKVNKINQERDGVTLHRNDGESRIAPTLYLQDMYTEYQKTGDLDIVLGKFAVRLQEAAFEAKQHNVEQMLDRDSFRDKVIFQLINTEQNKETLERVPHRQFQDLSIIYRWVVDVERNAVASTLVTNKLMEDMKISEEELFTCASINTNKIMPSKVMSMNDLMREMFAKDGMPESVMDQMFDMIPAEQQMYVISNEKQTFGASALLYEENLHKLAEQLGSDLYILPSSLHEVIAISTNGHEPEMLAAMVNEINMGTVDLADRLSNQVYHYDKNLRKVTMATDTPNKRLDGVAMNNPEVTVGVKEQVR